MTEAQYLADLERQQVAFNAAEKAYQVERERLMAEIMPRLAPFREVIDAARPVKERCVVIVEGDELSRPRLNAYIPGCRDYWASKAWLRIAKWTPEGSDLWQWTLQISGDSNRSNNEIFLGNEGEYRDLKLQYPDMRKQAIDIIANAGWKILEEK